MPTSDKSNARVRRALTLGAIGLSAIVPALGASSALASQYPPGSMYGTPYGQVPSDNVPGGQVLTLTEANTGLLADDANNSMSAGTQMIQWGANGGYNQNWVFVPSTGANAGYDEIQNRQSGLCLDVSGASTAQDAPVIQWTCSGNANQQWQLRQPSGGEAEIVNKNSGGLLAVSGGETNPDPSAGTALVQDVNGTNYDVLWRFAPVSYTLLADAELLTGHGANDPPSLYFESSQYDATNWACTNGYHFRMTTTGTYDSADNHWTTTNQAAISQAETPETAVASTDNIISTQQGPDSGWFPYTGYHGGIDEANMQQPISFTDAQVVSSSGNTMSDPDPAAANSGHGAVYITYGYTTAFQGQDLAGQVNLHCDPDSN